MIARITLSLNNQLIALLLVLSFFGSSQVDSNYLYIDTIDISINDSTERIQSLIIASDNSFQTFEDISELKSIALRNDVYFTLRIETNYRTIHVKNLNNYISPNSKYSFWINLNKSTTECVSGIYITIDGMQLLSDQTAEDGDNGLINEFCTDVYAGPTSYENFTPKYRLE